MQQKFLSPNYCLFLLEYSYGDDTLLNNVYIEIISFQGKFGII